MKYGNKLKLKPNFKEYKVHLNECDFDDLHLHDDCKGSFDVKIFRNVTYTHDTLGILNVPAMPFVFCDTCGASYLADDFEEFMEQFIAYRLIVSQNILNKNQIRFLRQFFGLSQEELAQNIGVSDKFEISKFESKKFPNRTMTPEKQIRMKLFYAGLFKVRADLADLSHLSVVKDEPVTIDSSFFPPEKDIKTAV